MQKNIHSVSIQRWILLPLRLFLSITFIYAGLQKITDPQFFQPAAAGYIGRQIAQFAIGSPIHGLLVSFAEPHAKFFGLLIIFGEIAIGLGTLFGFLFRPAAFFGMLLSLLFFLSASWHVYPYFYGADIVFTFSWLTLLLNGPLNTGLPSLDEILTLHLLQLTPLQQQQRLATFLGVVLGTMQRQTLQATLALIDQQRTQPTSHIRRGRQSAVARTRETRRTFLWGALTGGVTALGVVAFGYAFRILQRGSDTTVTGSGSAGSTAPAATVPTNVNTPSTAPSGAAIARVSAVPKNSATTFTISSSGDPGILVHLNNDQFVAYDALCTHAGCQVDYDPGSQLLQCPCHGATFDPSKDAAVVNPPASTPLTPLKIQVDSATGSIMLMN